VTCIDALEEKDFDPRTAAKVRFRNHVPGPPDKLEWTRPRERWLKLQRTEPVWETARIVMQRGTQYEPVGASNWTMTVRRGHMLRT
jgi:hypothetical protein